MVLRRHVPQLFLVIMVVLSVVGLPNVMQAAPPTLPTFSRFASARFKTASVSQLFGSTSTVVGVGELNVPDQVRFSQQDIDDPEYTEEIFIIGKTLYQLDPIVGVWDALRNVQGVNGTQGYEPGIDPSFIPAISSIVQLPNQVIDGVQCRHYRITIDSGVLLSTPEEPADPATSDELGVQLEIWIGVSDNFVHQQQQLVEFKDFSSDPPDSFTLLSVITYTNINEPVTITPPLIETPPTPAIPDAGYPIYPPKYPLAGQRAPTSLHKMINTVLAAEKLRHK